MRLLILLSITSLALIFSGCAKSGGSSDTVSDAVNGAAGSGGDSSGKSLFSVWNEENDVFNLDFRSAQIGGTSTVFITSSHVGSCTCQVTIQGSQASGTMVFSSCSNGSAGCISLKPSGTYTKQASTLQLCTSTSCINFR